MDVYSLLDILERNARGNANAELHEGVCDELRNEFRRKVCEECYRKGGINMARRIASNMEKRGYAQDEIADILELPADSVWWE